MKILLITATLALTIGLSQTFAQTTPKSDSADTAKDSSPEPAVTPNSTGSGNTVASGPTGNIGSFDSPKIYDITGGGNPDGSPANTPAKKEPASAPSNKPDSTPVLGGSR